MKGVAEPAFVSAPDGARLATDIYLPEGVGPWPTVLLRTYLGKESHRPEAEGWARCGFAAVVQDVRGRFGSEGDWRPYLSEREDGRATVEWLLGRPWCDGRVAAVGGSYAAFSAWSAALGHDAVRAVISAVPAMRPMPSQPEDGGVFPLLSRLCWWATYAGTRQTRPETVAADLARRPELLQLPVSRLPDALDAELPGWQDAVASLEARGESIPISQEELAGLDVAALHVGGWHDTFCSETLRHFQDVARDVTPRPRQALVLGPWRHQLGGHRAARYGERLYGPRSRFRLGAFQARWLREALDGDPAGDSEKTSIHLFLGGTDRWLTAARWSEQPFDVERFFGGDGQLLGAPDARHGSARLDYDPHHPRACRRTPLDESDLAEGEDVCVFTSPPLAAPCPIVGPPRLTLWASTDAPAADWVARLLEVTADGRRLYLAHGLVDAAQALAARGEALVPNAVNRFEILFSPVGFVVPAGHRLRLEVTASAFPSYARNLASGAPRLSGVEARRSVQTVHWGPGRPLVLELPLHVDPARLPVAPEDAAREVA